MHAKITRNHESLSNPAQFGHPHLARDEARCAERVRQWVLSVSLAHSVASSMSARLERSCGISILGPLSPPESAGVCDGGAWGRKGGCKARAPSTPRKTC